jgi:long-subunit acyl-CoA synthetase (AMP-forming)
MNLEAVGYALQGVINKIFNPDEKGTGEVCCKGRSSLMGYKDNEGATKDVIDV